MKKVIFCLQTMVLGGVEKELLAVLKQIHDQYDITLLLLYPDDTEILKAVPSDIKIRILGIDREYYCCSALKLVAQRLKRGKVGEAVAVAMQRFLRIGMATTNTNIDDIQTVDEVFDVAICYHIHSPLMLKYVAEKIHSRKKIGWIHSDFYCSHYPVQRLKKYVLKYDEFVAVSKKVENEFRTLCSWYCGEVSTTYNYLDEKEIMQLSEAHIENADFLCNEGVKLLTVGRFSKEKGIDLAISACAMLKKEKLNFHWFLIGYGEQESLYRKLIDEYGVGDCFTILGRKTNPYPYIKNCDIYVQPSRHEAFGLVIAEAKILRKPIVCTDFDGADEQINSGVNGIIVPLNDEHALTEALSELISSPESRMALARELEKWSPQDDLREIVKHFEQL